MSVLPFTLQAVVSGTGRSGKLF